MKKSNIETKRMTRGFFFTLTREDIADRGISAADIADSIHIRQRAFDHLKSKFKGEIDGEKNELGQLLQVIKEGREYLNVECEEIRDFEAAVVQYVYHGEILEERKMTDEERQLRLMPDAKVDEQKVVHGD